MASSTAALSCGQTNCDFVANDAAELAAHQAKSSANGTRWACAAYDCGKQYCTTTALGDDNGSGGHIVTCPKYEEWTATRKYGFKTNAKVIGTCLFRAKQIADGSITAARKAYFERNGKTQVQEDEDEDEDEEETDGDEDYKPKSASKPSPARRPAKKPKTNAETPSKNGKQGSDQREDDSGEVGEDDVDQDETQATGDVSTQQAGDEIVVASASQPLATRRGPRIKRSPRTEADAEAIKAASQGHGCSVCAIEFATHGEAKTHTDQSNKDRFECPACEDFVVCEGKPLAKHMRECIGVDEWMSKNGVRSVDWRTFTNNGLVELATSHIRYQASQAKAGPNALFAMVMPGETKESWARKAAEAVRREANLARPVMLKAQR